MRHGWSVAMIVQAIEPLFDDVDQTRQRFPGFQAFRPVCRQHGVPDRRSFQPPGMHCWRISPQGDAERAPLSGGR